MVQIQEGETLTIGKLAASADVGVETVRFYQRKGLLDTPTRNGGFRQYNGEDVRRLRFIREAQKADLTLEQIRELLKLGASEDRSRSRQFAEELAGALNTKIADLERARESLERLARDCAEGTEGPCPVIASFNL